MPQGESGADARSARPTMKDVAALAGLSIKTVSRVVNGVSTVDPELATRVQDAARKLGYRPNLTASNLRRSDGRTLTIGMLVEDAANPFSAALMRAAEDIARSRGVLVLFGSLDEDPARERELVEALLDRRVDGLVMVPAGRDQSYLAAEQQAGTRMVFVDREPGLLGADAVVSDNRQGAITAVEHLLAHGHRRIGYLGDQITIPTAAQRFDGYQYALEYARLPLDPDLVRHDLHSTEAAEEAVEQLLALPEPPTALFTSQNLVTIAACRALRRLRKHQEVAMVGFDDFPLADILEPGISVIAQDADALGRIAAQVLFSRLDGDTSATRTMTVPTRLIPRGSGELTPRSVRA
ncbi:LacI family transcriptional regulator [Streptacidiphilus pinicola]|uniref:LacI family transcriptional regulator n=1 Tax=Streptacidiphilus pinicola TaxID=2219663 RepID=A0A2X0K448_9ACTN|nr:LacI family DNA-binding transcriptional regulator [Streptacidiphilus pinicola]RAG84025.1 LacI family transcriptional regulator [Streptacidiphilus pinicola]